MLGNSLSPPHLLTVCPKVPPWLQAGREMGNPASLPEVAPGAARAARDGVLEQRNSRNSAQGAEYFGQVFWAGGTFLTNRIKCVFPEFGLLPSSLFVAFRGGNCCSNSPGFPTTPISLTQRAFPSAAALAGALSSSIWPCPLSAFPIRTANTIPILFFITVCFVYPGQ